VKRPHALGLLLATAALWSTGGILIKSVVWTPLAIAGFRSAVATLVLLALCRPLVLDFSRYQILGALAYTGTVILFVTATKMTTAANAILLQYTAPIWVALFAFRFLGERTRRMDWFAVLLALSGMGLFFGDRLSSSGVWGNVWAIVSGLSFAWLTLFFRKLSSGAIIGAVLLGNILTALICAPFAFNAGWPDGKSVGLLVVMGVFQLALPYFFYAKAIPHVTALGAMMIQFIEPILNPIWVLLILGEKPGRLALVGGAMILGAVVMRSARRIPRRRAAA
jgi:drug/metabolite transporter (DMT)-like permease